MRKRFSTFGLLNFFIVLVLLLRQIYYMNLISSFIISNEVEYGLILLLSLMILASLLVYVAYYLPALLTIKIVLNFETNITLPIVRVKYKQYGYYFVPVQNRLFKKLQVIRCWFLNVLFIDKLKYIKKGKKNE